MENDSQPDTADTAGAAAKPYVAPTLTFVGSITDIVQHGAGKLSVDSPDGPDVRKPPGQ